MCLTLRNDLIVCACSPLKTCPLTGRCVTNEQGSWDDWLINFGLLHRIEVTGESARVIRRAVGVAVG